MKKIPHRLISSKGLDVIIQGRSQKSWSDLYHELLILSWPKFFSCIVMMYIVINLVFALFYFMEPGSIANAKAGSFLDLFFFSVQTMATIGYGSMYPQTVYANVIVSIEALIGLVGVALFTGLSFARFSKPTAKVLFSKFAVIHDFNGIPTLMFRTSNQRYNYVLEAMVSLTLVRDEFLDDGSRMRRFYDLKLIRNSTPVFVLSWTVMHPIDGDSPLYGLTREQLLESESEILITLTGLDESVSQTIHARHSYIVSEILWDMKFVNILERSASGQRMIDFKKFHEVVSINES